jgi:hypothetical protein
MDLSRPMDLSGAPSAHARIARPPNIPSPEPPADARARRIRRLNPDEVASYDLVAPAIARRAVLIRVPLLPPGAVGLTSGRFVLLRRDEPEDGSSDLIAHELVHVRQFAEAGRLRFAATYLLAYLHNLVRFRRHRLAYLNIPAEQEAYGMSREWLAARRQAPRPAPAPASSI